MISSKIQDDLPQLNEQPCFYSMQEKRDIYHVFKYQG
jgi:hypothetical protein